MPRDLTRLLRPRSIAVFGGQEARNCVEQLQGMGFAGEIWPVHPGRDRVAGLPTVPGIADLPGVPDASFIGVNRQTTISIVRELARIGAGGAVCYASGFSESDDGRQLQADLVDAAADMPILGPNCYGLINYIDGALLWPDQHGGERVERGVALISQSSNILINLTMQQRGLPIAYASAIGNQAQTGLPDLIQAFADDPRVTAIGLYVEGFGDVIAFERACRAARQARKPIVLIKGGRSDTARTLALSHTASLTGADRITEAYCRRLGIARMATLPEMLETLKLLNTHGPLPGARLGSMSCSGGEAILMADAAQHRDVSYPPLTGQQKADLRATLSDLVTVSNPFDYHTFIWNDQDRLHATYRAFAQAPFDLCVLVIDLPRPDRCDGDTWEPAFAAFRKAILDTGSKGAVVASMPEGLPEHLAKRFLAAGVAPLCGIAETMAAVEASARIGRAWREPEPAPMPGPVLTPSGQGYLVNEADAKQLLKQFGLNVPLGARVGTVEAARSFFAATSGPVVAKAVGGDLAHKSELGLVRLNLSDAGAVARAVQDLLPLTGDVLLEEMVQDAVAELLIGVKNDPLFGPVLTVGAGGVLVELLEDSQSFILPVGRATLKEGVGTLKVARLLKGYRGRPAGDLEAVLDAIESLAAFALEHAKDVIEIEINPLIVLKQGDGVKAVDALLRLAGCSENMVFSAPGEGSAQPAHDMGLPEHGPA